MNINKSIIKFCSACGSKLEAPVKSGKPVKCEKCPKTSYLDPKVAVAPSAKSMRPPYTFIILFPTALT